MGECHQKNKERLPKGLMKGIKVFLKKKKVKRVNMLVNDLEIFLKKGKTKSVNMFVSDKKNLPEEEKQSLIEYRRSYSKMQKNKY